MGMRVLTNLKLNEDQFELTIRPESFIEYIGQKEITDNLKVFIGAAKKRKESLDHVLLYGPPGLGKTTLAHIIAHEMGGKLIAASGPSIEKSGDLAALLSTLEAGDVLFIDEIHRLPCYIEEILYPAMEDYTLEIMVGSDGKKRHLKVDLPPFTLVGATTRVGDLSSPLRNRFGIILKLNYYHPSDLAIILNRTGQVLKVEVDQVAAVELANRSRGTPRIANRLLKRVSDFALVMGNGIIDLEITKLALTRLQVDHLGLDQTDGELLKTIITKFNGGPVGVDALAAVIGEEVTTIEDVYEPYLLQRGFLKRTKRGRIVTTKAYQHLGMEPLKNES